MIVCEGCGGPLPPRAPTGRPRRFCTAPCRARTHRNRHTRAAWSHDRAALYIGAAADVLATLPAASVHTVVTSPPYWSARDYGAEPGQLGHEPTVGAYVAALVAVLDEARRVLRPDGTLWLVLGDSYAGRADASVARSGRRDRAHVLPPRRSSTDLAPRGSLLGVPWRVAHALTDRRWILRNAITWVRPNDLPHPTRTRLDNRTETVFVLASQDRYRFDRAALGEHDSDVWTIPLTHAWEAHPAPFPVELARRAVVAGCPPGGTVLDPFAGSGTTGRAALDEGRRFVGIELHRPYAHAVARRLGLADRSETGPDSTTAAPPA